MSFKIKIIVLNVALTLSLQTSVLNSVIQHVSNIASTRSDSKIDCSFLLADVSSNSLYNTCAIKSVPYYNETNGSTSIVQFNWNNRSIHQHERCFCTLSLLTLLVSSDPLQSYICQEHNLATINCTSVCSECSNDCSSSLQCLIYGHTPYNPSIINNLSQLYLISNGISCSTISQHSFEICNVLFQNNESGDHEETTTIINTLVPLTVVLVTLLLIVIIMCIICIVRKNKAQTTSPSYAHSNVYNDQSLVNIASYYNEEINKLKSKFVDKIVSSSDYRITGELGEGEFGIVYKGILFESASMTSCEVAIKSLKDEPTLEQIRDFMSESAIMLDFDHPNILKLLGVCFDTNDQLPVIILPYMANGDLKSFLISKRGENEPIVLPEGLYWNQLVEMCTDIVRGMNYLSDIQFIHRDLAARNCMVNDCLIVKVADFGFSKDIYNEDYYRLQRRTKLPVKWLPPESLLDNIYSQKTDVWSFGIVCWEIFSLGRSPYPGIDNADIPEYISAGNRLKKPILCTDEIYCMMCKCWNANSKERPTFSQLLREFLNLKEYWSTNSKPPYFILEENNIPKTM